jgi:periplasmic divalent cation tolerance protein
VEAKRSDSSEVDFIQVHTTTEKRKEAEKIANALVEKRMAACVHIVGPVVSTYRWKGKVETVKEWLCLIKTRRDLYDKVEKIIREMHSYETPEIVGVSIVVGSRDYLEWINNELQDFMQV